MKKILNAVSTIILILLLFFLFLLLFQRFTNNDSGIFGMRFLRVVTDSMEPEISVGDVIYVRKTSAEEVDIGETVVYRSESGLLAGQLITHKLMDKKQNTDGTWTLQTQGVKEGAPMDDPIRDDQLVGRVVRKMNLLTLLYSVFLTKAGLALVLVPTIALMIVEACRIIKTVRKEKEEYVQENKESEIEK